MEQRENFNYIKLVVIGLVLMMSLAFVKSSEANNQPNSMQAVVNQADKNISFPAQQSSVVSDSCTAYFKGTLNVDNCRAGEVPLPAATWLFILALLAFVGLSNKRKV